MDISYFHEFVVLAQTLNYQETAERLYLTQSSLTRHIQKLESDLGVELFERTTRRIRLTHYGQLMLPYAQQIADTEAAYTSALTQEHNLDKNLIRIGGIPVMFQYQITDLLADFQKDNPSVRLKITEADSMQLTEQLKSGDLDFAILRESPEAASSFARVPITEDTLAALLPLTHPLAKAKAISLQQLYRDQFLLLERDTFMYSLCLRECRNAGFEPHIAFTSRRLDSIIGLVSKGMGVGLLTKKPVLAANHADIAVVDIRPAIPTTINLAYLPGQKLSASKTQLIRLFTSRHSKAAV